MAHALGRLPVLRPGRHVLRRDADTLQVGVGERPVRLPDVPAVGVLLEHLDPRPGVHPSAALDLLDPQVRSALELLEAAGHLTAADRAEPAPFPLVGLTVVGPGLLACAEEALGLAGIADQRDAPLRLLVSNGPLPRDAVDDLLRDAVPHLLVSALEGGWRIGPFVSPGVTACLRCVDAHHAASDPRHSLLLAQAARAARERPETPDPLQARWALSWAAHDLRTYLAGGEPSTWSTTIDLAEPGSSLGAPVIRRWLRHPDCGCSWDLLLELP